MAFFSTARAGGEIWTTGGALVATLELSEHLFRAAPRALTCQDYQVTQSAGALTPGTLDIGNHCDDCSTAIALPFPVRFYDQTFTSVSLTPNGNAQFANGSVDGNNTALPASGVGTTIFPFWDNLRTDGVNLGIFTSVSGTAPNRVFNIDWRVATFDGSGRTEFELRLFEGLSRFETLYDFKEVGGGFTGTIGAQRDAVSLFTQFAGPNADLPASGTRLIFTQGCCPPIAFTGTIGSNSTTYPGTSGLQKGQVAQTAAAIGCGEPKSFPGAQNTGTSFAYDTYSFVNPGAAACVTFRVDTACTGSQNINPVVYLGSFDPLNVSTNYLGDGGANPPNPSGAFSVNVPANATVVLVISEVTAGGGCGNYSVSVEGLRCAPVPLSTLSRKTHGAAGDFDIVLAAGGTSTTECRTGGATGDYQMVINFANAVTLTGSPQALVTSGVGAIGSGGTPNSSAVSVSGSTVIVPLTNVGDAQTLTVALPNVNEGTSIGPVSVLMRVLIGDTNSDAVVNAGDAIQTRSRSGLPTTTGTFRSDVNADGTINSGDAIAVRGRSGTSVP